ncbi:hypothetical protein BX600DRAFT_433463 [Xylariales sp. PMI_506]|nr:hypothetical protein BX600DRAFT_433463 [Xylariales sp. PMI_506]
MDDPWDWDNDRVVKEFCTEDRTWVPTSTPPKLPDLARLEFSLRQHEIDGETLLGPASSESDFFPDLGVKAIKHKATFRAVITQLRRRSRKYKLFQIRQVEDADQDDEYDSAVTTEAEKRKRLLNERRTEDDRISAADQPVAAHFEQLPTPLPPGFQEPVPTNTSSFPTDTLRIPEGTNNVVDVNSAEPTVISRSDLPLESKRRRIAPTVISTELAPGANRVIPSKADAILDRLGLSVAGPILHQHSNLIPTRNIKSSALLPGVYLGDHSWSRADMLEFDFSNEPLAPEEMELDSFQDESFREFLPPGRRRQVGRFLKRRFLKHESGFRHPKPDIVPGYDDPENDLVLPPLGDSDNEYDSETWAEIQAEDEERKKKAEAGATLYSREEKISTVEKIIADLELVWEERKLPRLERTAFRVWTDAQKRGFRSDILEEEKQFNHFESRLRRYGAEIIVQEWTSQNDIKTFAGILEATVESRKQSLWRLNLLNSQTPPPKQSTRPSQTMKPRSRRLITSDDEEILTSESEDEMSSFIVHDKPEPQDITMKGMEANLLQETPGIISVDPVSDIEPDPSQSEVIYSNSFDTTIANESAKLAENEFGNESKELSQDGIPIVPEVPTRSPELLTGDLFLIRLVKDNDASSSVQVNPTRPGDNDIYEAHPNGSTSNKGIDMDLNVDRRSDISSGRNHGSIVRAENDEEILDLTQLDSFSRPKIPSASTHREHPEVIDLTTPERDQDPDAVSPRTPTSRLVFQRAMKLSPEQLRALEKRQVLVHEEVGKLDASHRSPIFHFACSWNVSDIWWDFVIPGLNAEIIRLEPFETEKDKDIFMALIIIRLFDLYILGSARSLQQYARLGEEEKQEIKGREGYFRDFIEFLRKVSVSYQKIPVENGHLPTPPIGKGKTPENKEGRMVSPISDDDSSEEEDPVPSSRKKRKPVIVKNVQAINIRERDQRRVKEQAERRNVLRARLAIVDDGNSSNRKNRFIINESKEDDQEFIYVPDRIARHIKDHQISGIRFMWNQIVMDRKARQGCLLAHTMGLGKTMQIITLLMIIAAAAASQDPSVSSQIPEDLRESRTLILAPSGLVNNWMDELLIWTMGGHHLGNFNKIDADTNRFERPHIIDEWVSYGGVLVIGYDLFKKIVQESNGGEGQKLTDSPNIVIADEAHNLKNPNSNVHKTTARFQTSARIAMTGSPLANSVREYHSMINWVAPNYLSNLTEFRLEFANPIEDGLSSDSTPYMRRKALKKLQTLNKMIAPKVQRRTITSLKDSLPAKMEFVISVPLTEMQREAYVGFMQHRNSSDAMGKAFATLQILALICNHPACFRERLMEEKDGKRKTTKANGESTGEGALPPQLVSHLLAKIPHNAIRGTHAEMYSWKVPLLNKILDESKQVKDKILVFSHSIRTLNYLEQVLRRRRLQYSRLDGSTPVNVRQNIVKEFNTRDIDVFLISTAAGGFGLNITGANRVVLFDFRWNPQYELQAVGRAYRLGQTKPVFVYRFLCGGTFEEKMQNKGIFKIQLASRVVDEKNPIPKAQRMEEMFEMPVEPTQKDLAPFAGKDIVLDKILNSEVGKQIRSIVMSDTFEEENLEEEHLTEQEQLEVQLELQRMMEGQQSRIRSTHQLPHTDGQISSTQVPLAVSSTPVPLPVPHAQRPIQTGVRPRVPQGFPTMNVLAATAITRVAPIDSPIGTSIPPVLGSSTHLRQSPVRSTLVQSEQMYWLNNLQAFKGELVRAFIVGETESNVKEKKAQAAQEVTASFSRQSGRKNREALASSMWAVMGCAQSRRFSSALAQGLLSADEICTMEPSSIKTICDKWDKMSQDQWKSISAGEKATASPTPSSTAANPTPTSAGQFSVVQNTNDGSLSPRDGPPATQLMVRDPA